MSDTLRLASELIERPSVTPDDAGCLELISERLTTAGFVLERLPFGEVDNLWARHGAGAPLLVFAGHTDVVPPGPEAAWSTPPFEPVVREGMLHGRGAADMKGSVAAMVTACCRFAQNFPEHGGSVALLLTSDEEGIAVDGTVRVVEELGRRGEKIDWCIVGEPSSETTLGDNIKVGRRGSVTGHLTVHGTQGHVAYPQRALNPIHALAPALKTLTETVWDEGNENFPPTTFQVSNIQSGTGADNVIPGELTCAFNFRHSTAVTEPELRQRTAEILDAAGLDYQLDWLPASVPFLTKEGRLVEAVSNVVKDATGLAPALSTGGGTSDGRFIAPTGTEVVELGPLNTTIHRVNECVSVADLDALEAIYHSVMQEML
ncbi:MAG: succinyl-diaminopimelate desuccinylase [Gammaproteobacteria bacterium]|nr:MAG: succinyl-diaminopimelate desuccinylase [Gammaproteobacteria bacterium]